MYELLIKLDDDNTLPGERKWKRGCQDVEISIIKKSNRHGYRSWGWADEDKIIISNNQTRTEWNKQLYLFYVRIAKAILTELNYRK